MTRGEEADAAMVPLQAWFAALSESLGDPQALNDQHHAFSAWDGEQELRLVPGLRKPYRWRVADDPLPFAAIGGRAKDCFYVLHIHPDGRVSGPLAGIFQDGRVNGFVGAALDAFEREGAQPYEAPPELDIGKVFPLVRNGRVVRRHGHLVADHSPISYDPGPLMPFASVRRRSREVVFRMPPKDWPPGALSIEADSHARYGPLDRTTMGNVAVAVSRAEPTQRGPSFLLSWPAPLKEIMPLFAGWDAIYAIGRMLAVWRRSIDDPGGALREAREAAAPYLSQGQSTVGLVHFLPHARSEEHVRYHAQALRLLPESELRADLSSAGWQKALGRTVPIRRTWGAIGFLWALLVDEIQGVEAKSCERCGWPVSGRRRLCGPEDNRTCYLERRKHDQRRSRDRR